MTDASTPLSERLRRDRMLAIVRGVFTGVEIDAVADALLRHGFGTVEVTWNSPDAAEHVARLAARADPELLVGAGTIVHAEQVRRAVAAGARFLVSPGWDPDVWAAAQRAGVPLLPGVFTASEVQAARAHGARLLKLFPAHLHGPSWMRALSGPFDDVRFVPTGGVTTENLGAYLRAGAFAVAIGSALFRPGRDPNVLHDDVADLRRAIDDATAPASGMPS